MDVTSPEFLGYLNQMLNGAVDREFHALSGSFKAGLLRLSETIEAFGPSGLQGQYTKHLEGKLWELRIRTPEGIARAIYVAAPERRVIIVRIFVKKSQKTPLSDLQLAKQRMKQV